MKRFIARMDVKMAHVLMKMNALKPAIIAQAQLGDVGLMKKKI